MKIAVVVYVDSALEDAQTGTVITPADAVEVVGFLLRDEPEYVTLTRELMGEQYRGQVSIPRCAIERFEIIADSEKPRKRRKKGKRR